MKKQYKEPSIKSKELLTELPFNLSIGGDAGVEKGGEEEEVPSTGDGRAVDAWDSEE